MSEEHQRRPPLDRMGPNRDFATLLGRARAAAGPDEFASSGGAEAYGPYGPEGAPGAAGNFVGEGVGVAYKVIEAYMRQGQQVAQQFGQLAYAPLSLGSELQGQQARWMQIWTDLMANWFDMVGLFTETMVPRGAAAFGPAAPLGAPGPFGGPAPPAAPPPPSSFPQPPLSQAPPVSVAYDIESTRPTRVQAEFQPGRETLELASHGLRCLDPGCPQIDVAFSTGPGDACVVVSIRVPDDQTPGLYTGTLLDARDGSPVGTLSLGLR